MVGVETAWKVLAAIAILWRLASFLFDGAPADAEAVRPPQFATIGPLSGRLESEGLGIFAGRLMQCLYWASVWMSAQLTIWVICGFGGLVLNWAVLSGVARLCRRSRGKVIAQCKAAGDVRAIPQPAQECNGAARLCL
jgi:hypothetical protein